MWWLSLFFIFAAVNAQLQPPALTALGLVHPQALSIEFRAGFITKGQLAPYAAQSGDTFIDFQTLGSWLLRSDSSLYLMTTLYGQNYTKALDTQTGIPLNTTWADTLTSYTLERYDFAGRKLAVYFPTLIARKSKPLDCGRVAFSQAQCYVSHRIYLQFPLGLTEGALYTLQFKSSPYSSIQNTSFVFDSTTIPSEAIHVNLAGYRALSPEKKAFLSVWAGSFGGISYNDSAPLSFRIVEDSTGITRFSGLATFRKASTATDEDYFGANLQKADVWEMNFGSFQTPGAYRLVVTGIGCSLPFAISGGWWTDKAVLSAKELYYQRSGVALVAPYSTYSRPAPQEPSTMKKVQYWSNATLLYTSMGPIANDDGSNPDFPLSFTQLVNQSTNVVCNVSGGYMDAGDWDRRAQHLIVNRFLLDLYERNRTFWSGVSFSIPESTNSYPDIVDTALWNLDFFVRLQRPSGGVGGGAESEEHPITGQVSWESTQRWFCYQEDPWVTYSFAASAAQAARILAPLNSTLSSYYRSKAELAWNWGEINRFNIPTAGKSGNFSILVGRYINDARNLAAADLFRLTNNATYHTAFLNTSYFTTRQTDLFSYDAIGQLWDQSEAAWVYAQSNATGTNLTVQNFARQAILSAADTRVAQYNKMGFGFAKGYFNPSVCFSAIKLQDIIRGYFLANSTAKQTYLNAVEGSMNWGLGANPNNKVFTTGVPIISGSYDNLVQRPLHVDTLTLNMAAPPGLTVCGAAAPAYMTPFFGLGQNQHFYPDWTTWPNLEFYADLGFYGGLMADYSIQDLVVPNFYNWGFLAMVTL